MEDNLLWKTTFCGRRPLVEDKFRWKTNFGGIQPSVGIAHIIIANIAIQKANLRASLAGLITVGKTIQKTYCPSWQIILLSW